jgi:flagellar capping protein FliD
MRATVAASNASNSTMASLMQVGVSTGGPAAGGTPNPDAVAGKLTLDTTALTNAITNDFARTKAQFTTTGDDPAQPAAIGKLGLVVQRFGSAASGLIKGQIDSQQSQMDSLSRQSDALDLRLKTKEASLRARFTAMETALAQSQAQGQSIASHVAQLTSGR